MKCAACGAELPEGTKFCTQCGHTVDGTNVIDQGSAYQQGTNYNYASGANPQGTDYGQGTGYNQGAGYQQGTGYNQGAGYQQGTGYNQGAGYQQGTGYNQGSGYGYNPNAGYQQGTGYNQGAAYNQGPLTKKEFYKLPGVKNCRTNIRVCAIIVYVCAGITLLASLLLAEYLSSSILDGLLLLGLGLWLQLGRSRVCAIIITAYGCFNMIVALAVYGTVQGWLIPVAGIYAIIYTFKYQKMWDNYEKNGVMP